MRSLEELKKIDDGGSFERLVGDMERAANGDESLKLKLPTKSIVKDFVNLHSRKAVEPKCCLAAVDQKGRANEQVTGNDGILNLKVRFKRCFLEQEQQQEKKEEEIVKKPAAKRQRKSDGLEKKINQQTEKTIDHPKPDLPQNFKDKIMSLNGTNVMLVTQKEVTCSDLNRSQGRFSVARLKAMTHDFLTEEELKKMDPNGLNGEIPCSLIEPCLEVTNDLRFKKWVMGETFSYVLKKRWNLVSGNRMNRLKKDVLVQLWSFRVGLDLWFALVNLQQPQE